MAKVKSRMQRQETIAGWAFITPYLILFLIFTFIPFVSAFVLSFTNVKFITSIADSKFVGFSNFVKIFTNTEMMQALLRTAIYSVVYVPVIMVLGFVLAMLVNKGVHAKNVVRSMVFMPYVSNMMAVGVVFSVMLGATGPLVGMLKSMGMENPPILLQSTTWALPTVAIIAVWKGIGLNMMTYLGALQNVNSELEEAAQIDGANKWQRIRNVVIPMVSPTTFFLLISSIITSLQNFTVIQALTQGGPGQSTTVMSTKIYQTAFVKQQMGMASALSLILFAIVMIFTIIQWRGQNKWVNY